MEVQVYYAAQLKQAAGGESEIITLAEEQTVGDLISRVVEKHGQAMRKLLLGEDGTARRSILVFVGEEPVGRDFDRVLRNGEEVTILSPVAGG